MSGFVLSLRFFIVGGCFCLHMEDVRCNKKSCTQMTHQLNEVTQGNLHLMVTWG